MNIKTRTMKNFTVVFISNGWLNEEDPSDHKEWTTVSAKNNSSAIAQLSNRALVISCTED
tara:strand:- start:3778 stop:3957 length:180 start_codon:yes stop_codon:yes gene_type:complete